MQYLARPQHALRNLGSDSSWAILFIYLFIFGCVGSSLLRAGFLWLQQAGVVAVCGLLTAVASLVAEHGL